MGEAVLGAIWGGLNRGVAAHLLTERESPDCVDCAPASEVSGLLGARAGRTKVYNRDYNIRGVGFLTLPTGRLRVVATDDGVWHPVSVPWSGLGNAQKYGWDRVRINGLSVSRAGNGDTYSAALSIPTAKTLGNYSVLLFGDVDDSAYGGGGVALEDQDIAWSGTVDGYIGIQGRIDTVWTDLFRVSVFSASGYIDVAQLKNTAGTGSLDQLRGHAHITSGGGNLSCTFQLSLYLLYPGEQSLEIAV